MGYIKGMIVQSDGSKPHVVFIMETLAKQFPYTIWKIGGKVSRTTAKGTPSAHSTGRACDIYLEAGDPLDKKLGDLLFNMFHQNAVDLKVDHTIWNRHIWSHNTGGPLDFTNDLKKDPLTNGGAHTNHIHVAFKNEPLTSRPMSIVHLCQQVHARYIMGGDGAADRAEGLYGKAFDPKHPNTRLTAGQRKQILLKNMGMVGADRI